MPRNLSIVDNHGLCPQCKIATVVRKSNRGTMPRCTSCLELNRMGRNSRQIIARKSGLWLVHYNKNGVRYGREAEHRRYFISRLKLFGLTEFWWDNKEKKCDICGITLLPPTAKHYNSEWCFDHNHSCCGEDKGCPECFRGLICNSCNKGLGNFKDNEGILLSAIEYLRKKQPI